MGAKGPGETLPRTIDAAGRIGPCFRAYPDLRADEEASITSRIRDIERGDDSDPDNQPGIHQRPAKRHKRPKNHRPLSHSPSPNRPIASSGPTTD